MSQFRRQVDVEDDGEVDPLDETETFFVPGD
jgi:hypothetical protein